MARLWSRSLPVEGVRDERGWILSVLSAKPPRVPGSVAQRHNAALGGVLCAPSHVAALAHPLRPRRLSARTRREVLAPRLHGRRPRGMALSVVALAAQPLDIKRARVVGVMRLNLACHCAALACRRPDKRSGFDRVVCFGASNLSLVTASASTVTAAREVRALGLS